ncbi:hypothetical protein B0T20DRAFT_225400 [Sordaria brevicollis]|uniref:Uncharacterized protein n=1 Tax=Sordaria brevicollis TaxID=83679 RepID=A0AAE0PD25_SORBR|nr:hypothetical protein B0T20DRAFT_225400 [Sordaria brevicollis]
MGELSDSELELEATQATQATQEALDPRRFGEQQSGFSDEDLADIICILIPYSNATVPVAERAAELTPNFVIEQEHTSRIRMNYNDTEQVYPVGPKTSSPHNLVFRFSSKLKNDREGFVFGRDVKKCDVTVSKDEKVVSNTHFKIYFNEHGFLMIEDLSLMGTWVGDVFVHSGRKDRFKTVPNPPPKTYTLGSGSEIMIPTTLTEKVAGMSDAQRRQADIRFMVRIPHRLGRHAEVYDEKLTNYLQRTRPDPNQTIVPGPDGRLDVFRNSPHRPSVGPSVVATRQLASAWTLKGSHKYNFLGKIGQGAFATVYGISDKMNGFPYAAKELEKRRFMKNGVLDQKVKHEMQIMKRISHPNIVQFKEALDLDDTHLYIIMEYVGGGDLTKYVDANGRLPEPDAQTIARQLVGALDYLHGMNITHRDVKPDNILIHSQSPGPLVVKLTDFGLSKMIDNQDATFLRTFCGTLLYCAPEVYVEFGNYDVYGRRIRHGVGPNIAPKSPRYDHKVDIWSLGGVLYYALTTEPPYTATNGIGHAEFLHQVMTTVPDLTKLIKKLASPNCQRFVSSCLTKRPENRPTTKKLLKHEWIRASPNGGVDELLEAEASQLSLHDIREATPDADGNEDLTVASDDNLLQQELTEDENHVGHSAERDKENHAPRSATQDEKLFGEVSQSALGSQGQVVEKRLNLPATPKRETIPRPFRSKVEIPDSQACSDDEEDTPRQNDSDLQWSQPIPLHISSDAGRSVSVVNNVDHGGNSQSLDGAESIMGQLDMQSRRGVATPSIGADSNRSSKRKASHTTDSIPRSPVENEPAPKKPRSAKRVGDYLNRKIAPIPDEDELLAHMKGFEPSKSHSQVPQAKSVYWDSKDETTHHLDYPEMTVAQWNAFRKAAEDRKVKHKSTEKFEPNQSPLWALAEKYFPPMSKIRDEHSPLLDLAKRTSVERQQAGLEYPKEGGYLRSSGESLVPGISVRLSTSIVTWGSSRRNTTFCDDHPNIPKCAFKIMVWREENFDPSQSSSVRPWFRDLEKRDLYFFYIATKAPDGIYINGQHLPSNDHEHRESSCKNWMRLYNGDKITIWRESHEDDTLEKIELVFDCTWGGSKNSRESSEYPIPQPVSEEWAKKLDMVCVKAEKKARSDSRQVEWHEQDNEECTERKARIQWEQELSKNFKHQCRRAKSAPKRKAAEAGTGFSSGSSSSSSRQSSLLGYSDIVG